MHILFALPGLHRFNRGAEVVFESLAQQIASGGQHRVTLVGSGEPQDDRAYEFIQLPAVSRVRFEKYPKIPFLRNEFTYEDLTFARHLAALPAVEKADLTMTCSYPYSSWALRRPRRRTSRPAHVFVTQNGDWPALFQSGEARFFSCDGLICTNPIYYERNRARWHSTLIPNGVDPSRFQPGAPSRQEFGLPTDRPVVLMVSALEPGKRVLEAMRAIARLPEVFLVVAGDGALRDEVDEFARQNLDGRFLRQTFNQDQMPALYRSADLFLHTKILESFGNVYVEALCCGTPVVAHDDEVTRWILGDQATLVNSEDEFELSTAIARTLEAPHQDREAAAWARDRYAWDVVARKYVDFFEDVLDRRKQTSNRPPARPVAQGAQS